MGAFILMLKNVMIFVLLALPGFILVKTKQLKQEQSGALSKLLMYVGMPFLIITSTIDKITFDKELLLIMGVVAAMGVLYTVCMFFMSKPLSAMEREEKTRGMLRFAAIFSNNGFLGIPLAMAVFGATSRVLMVVIILNIITNILMYTLGIYLISGDKRLMSPKKALLNPVLIAFVIGVLLNLVDVKESLPEALTYSTHFSNIVTPISMTILGMKMGGVEFLKLFKSWKVYYVSALKLIAFPVFITAVLLVLKLAVAWIETDMILGVFIAFAMPTAGLASTFSDTFDGDTENAVAFTLVSTLFSVVTIPVLYALLRLCI